MKIQTVTVIGANGTMGRNVAGIFASFGGATVYLAARNREAARRVMADTVNSVKADTIAAHLIPVDYSELDACIRASDLIFESVVEIPEVKKSVLSIVDRNLRPDAVCCTGTSGLSVDELAEAFSPENRSRFCGMHMFNPPYTLTLCEMIPTRYVNRTLFEALRSYAEKTLLRQTVTVTDTPGFLGNRIGFQFINEALQCAAEYRDRGGIDYIDAILGGFTGRAMPPLATADFVGLDVHKSIVDYLLVHTDDFANRFFVLPAFVNGLISDGKTGRKAGAGFFRKAVLADGTAEKQVYDIASGEYRRVRTYAWDFSTAMKAAIREADYGRAFAALAESRTEEAELCRRLLAHYIVYSLAISKSVGGSVNAGDHVMATGFNWCPPVAMMEALSAAFDLPDLLRRHLEPGTAEAIGLPALLAQVQPSQYDYRRYFRSK